MTEKIITLGFLLFFCLSMLASCGEEPNSGADDTNSSGVTVESSDDIVADNTGDHDEEDDYTVDDLSVVTIQLADDASTAVGSGVSISGNTVTITSAGTYRIEGSLSNGQVIVDSDEDDSVKLLLNGVDISCSSSAPLYVKNAAKTIVDLEEGSINALEDGTSYVFDDGEDEPNAAFFSKDDLTIYGDGSLTVTGNYNDGIASKDGLIISGGTLAVTSVDDGIRGKDYLVVKGGTLTVTADGDGLKSDEDEDTTLGYISIEDGVFRIDAGADGIQASTDVIISGGEFHITTGGGSSSYLSSSDSAKGIKATVSISLDDGDFSLSSADDAVHSNGSIGIQNGSFIIYSGDDGIHADSSLEITGGDIAINQSSEGIEGVDITIGGGEIMIVSSDDGINASDGNEQSTGNTLTITGGTIAVYSGGDGLDSNGTIVMTGGIVIVHGPTENNNGALDSNSTFKMNGGVLVAAGSSGMAEAPSSSSTQYSVMVNFNASLSAGVMFHIETSAGSDIISFKPEKRYQSVVVSSPSLSSGTTYAVYYGGSCSGTDEYGVYSGGTYYPGTQYRTFTISSVVTTLGASSRY